MRRASSTCPSRGAGSGFIIDSDGYILTNHHVIDNAERITVTLADGRSFRGEVVGTDPAIDIALLKISGGRDLPEAPLGNSDDLRVGEWVCAIGNPLGYVHSVTVGVVSFIGRKLFDVSLDDYIQTDAAINFGNSGGPLINSRGQVIGINSAVSSRTSSIGFAVPINQAVAILPQLKAQRTRVARLHGRAAHRRHPAAAAGARPAGRSRRAGAGLHQRLAGRAQRAARLRRRSSRSKGEDIGSNEDLIRYISAQPPGSVVRVQLARDARRLTLPVRLAERPRDSADADALPGSRDRTAPPLPVVPLGLTVRELDRGFIGRHEIPDSVEGVAVARVDPTGAAFSAPDASELRHH